MSLYNQEIEPNALPFDLRDYREELGLIESAVIKCPGIYFLHMEATAEHYTGLDLYVVMNDAPIPNEARSYGQKLPTHPDLVLYQYEGEDDGYRVVEYEILKYYIKNNLPLSEHDNIHSLSLYGMEICPSYFGAFPAPMITPWGYTTRYKVLVPGVFWVETEQCKITVAIPYVMRDDITDRVYSLAKFTSFDQKLGLDNSQGYLFFQEKDICLIIFELIVFGTNQKWDMIDPAALMNAIWTYHPEYAAEYNLREQLGKNDYLGMIIREIVPEIELNASEERMIAISPNINIDFFCF